MEFCEAGQYYEDDFGKFLAAFTCKGRDEMTMDLARKTLDKISVSYVKRDGKRTHVQLYSALTGKQTLLLSSLLKVRQSEVEKALKEILV